MEYTVSDVSELDTVSRNILSELQRTGKHVVLFSGDLGAGKTALVQEIAKEIGITEKVISPTFVVRKSYEISSNGFDLLVHADLYRLEKESELDLTGLRTDLKNEKAIVCIEWPEQIPEVKSLPHISVTITHVGNEKRKIIVT
jgi:tRNA threonylcarbamoyladenosine biosynthesis protein TsaE